MSRKLYAGIGSRKTPDSMRDQMARLAAKLAEAGWILRSGRAKGADLAFETGVRNYAKRLGIDDPEAVMELFVAQDATPEAVDMASEYHPNWRACRPFVRKLHGRNMQIVLGQDLNDPVQFIACWTPEAAGGGGTGQALRLARALDIPVYDLADEPRIDALLRDVLGKKKFS